MKQFLKVMASLVLLTTTSGCYVGGYYWNPLWLIGCHKHHGNDCDCHQHSGYQYGGYIDQGTECHDCQTNYAPYEVTPQYVPAPANVEVQRQPTPATPPPGARYAPGVPPMNPPPASHPVVVPQNANQMHATGPIRL